MDGGRRWRLLILSTDEAAANMAIDEAVLEGHLSGWAPPTLRLYKFEPAAVSIGQTQRVPPDMVERIRNRGLDIVRRPTGGRAVLHAGDLTYSFVASQEDGGLSSAVTVAYKQICRGLQNAFEGIGVRLEMGEAHAPYRQLHDCFLATTGSDLHVGGRKMVGSAQLRRRHAVLQHGSILLDQDQGLMPEILGEAGGPASQHARHANLFEVAGRQCSLTELERLLKMGFESAFAAVLEPGELTLAERELANKLSERYRAFDSRGPEGLLPTGYAVDSSN